MGKSDEIGRYFFLSDTIHHTDYYPQHTIPTNIRGESRSSVTDPPQKKMGGGGQQLLDFSFTQLACC